jgi:hypothetical protein
MEEKTRYVVSFYQKRCVQQLLCNASGGFMPTVIFIARSPSLRTTKYKFTSSTTRTFASTFRSLSTSTCGRPKFNASWWVIRDAAMCWGTLG